MDEQIYDIKREKVRVIPIKYIDGFPNHPFQVKKDEEMEKLMESIKTYGVLTPIIVRKKEIERYEIYPDTDVKEHVTCLELIENDKIVKNILKSIYFDIYLQH